jgi:hypothetical protein
VFGQRITSVTDDPTSNATRFDQATVGSGGLVRFRTEMR